MSAFLLLASEGARADAPTKASVVDLSISDLYDLKSVKLVSHNGQAPKISQSFFDFQKWIRASPKIGLNAHPGEVIREELILTYHARSGRTSFRHNNGDASMIFVAHDKLHVGLRKGELTPGLKGRYDIQHISAGMENLPWERLRNADKTAEVLAVSRYLFDRILSESISIAPSDAEATRISVIWAGVTKIAPRGVMMLPAEFSLRIAVYLSATPFSGQQDGRTSMELTFTTHQTEPMFPKFEFHLKIAGDSLRVAPELEERLNAALRRSGLSSK